MGELINQFRLVDDELVGLLALNREDEISPAQLQRLDFLLDQRGQQIDEHIASLFAADKFAA